MLKFGANAKPARPAHPVETGNDDWADTGTQITYLQMNEIADILRSLDSVFSAGYVPGANGGTAMATALLNRMITEAQAAVDAALDGAPAALDTLNEIAAAIGDDPNFAGVMTNAIAAKLALTGGAMTGDLVLAGAPDSDLKAATKKYVDDSVGGAANAGKRTNLIASHIKLTIANDATNPDYQLDVAADEIVLLDGSSGQKFYSAFAETVDITVSGAGGLDTGSEASDTWYYIWAIAKEDDTKSVILSLSDTAPTMPIGYIYKGIVGAIYNGGSSNFLSISQIDRMVSCTQQTMVASGTATTGTALAPLVPEIARAAWGWIKGVHSTTNGRYTYIGPESGLTLGVERVGGNQTGTGYTRAAPWRVPIISAQALYYKVGASVGFNTNIYLNGWEY